MKTSVLEKLLRSGLVLEQKALGVLESTAAVGKAVGFACSGGADSVLLLLLLCAHYPELKAHFCILHFNHALRGEASEADQVFVGNLAEQLGVPIFVGRGKGDATSEGVLREERHLFFQKIMKQQGGGCIAFGHHLNDVAETMMMRLSRGSGLKGLAAPRAVQSHGDDVCYIRPLLGLSRQMIEGALQGAGIAFCTDHTNFEGAYYRNRIRQDVLPVWGKASPQPVAVSLARSRALLEEEDEALDVWLDRLWGEALWVMPVNWRCLKGYPKALHRRAFHRCLLALDKKSIGGKLSAAAVDGVVTALYEGQALSQSLGEGFLIFKEAVLDYVILDASLPPWGTLPLVEGGVIALPGGAVLKCEQMEAKELGVFLALPPDFKKNICLPCPKEMKAGVVVLQVRSWRPGDNNQPLGAPGRKKLQDQFVDRKVSESLRAKLPVVCHLDGTVLWAPGLVPSECVRLNRGVNCALRLTYQS